MNRGSRRWNIFLDDDDRLLFLQLLANMPEDHGVRVLAFCLMGNHYHLVLYCPEPSLSDAVHGLASRYAQLFNARHGFDGPLFRSRFTSVEIESDSQLLTTVRYVHRNPLELNANVDLAAYPWSSYAAYLGWTRTPKWLSTHTVLRQFGNDVGALQDFVEAPQPADVIEVAHRSVRPDRPHAGPGRSISAITPADVQLSLIHI